MTKSEAFGPGPGTSAIAVLLGLVLCGSAAAADSGATKPPAPAAQESAPPMSSTPATPSGTTTGKPKPKYAVVPSEEQIDINHASVKQLKALPGIGDAEAKKIVAGRPYKSKADLVTKNILPEGLYISIKYRIIVIPDSKQKPKK